jgi:2-polyprenyl-3-methyl-5-hydroxy-6-metoxy-1,4-benzoquinol methylase
MTERMKEGSKEWWNQKYATAPDYLYGKAPSSFLVENVDELRRGETLDVGMGEGRNAVFLASKGFTVTGIDFSEPAVERADKLAKESGATFTSKSLDLDFFLIPLMKYDTIVVCDIHPPLTLFKSLARGLNKGGTLFMEGYSMEQLRLSDGYKPEPFECFKPNEALDCSRELHVLYYNERQLSPKAARVQLLARKPLR